MYYNQHNRYYSPYSKDLAIHTLQSPKHASHDPLCSKVFLVFRVHLDSLVQLVLAIILRVAIAPFDVVQFVRALVFDHLQ